MEYIVKTNCGTRHFLKSLPEGTIEIKKLFCKNVSGIWFNTQTNEIIKKTFGKYNQQYPYLILKSAKTDIRYSNLREVREEQTEACIKYIRENLEKICE